MRCLGGETGEASALVVCFPRASTVGVAGSFSVAATASAADFAAVPALATSSAVLAFSAPVSTFSTASLPCRTRYSIPEVNDYLEKGFRVLILEARSLSLESSVGGMPLTQVLAFTRNLMGPK